MTDQPPVLRRLKGSAQLKWDTKPRRAPNPRDIEFQTAEVVISNPVRDGGQIGLASLFDGGGTVAMNRLIWGDSLLACQALLAQGFEGKIQLIYIDPPFKSDEDYSHEITLSPNHSVRRIPSMLERLAYRDMWVGDIDSYLDMLYPRLQLMRRLLASSGSLYVHIGPDVAAYVKVILDEIFGRDRLKAEIVWQSVTSHNDAKTWGMVHQYIYHYGKSEDIYFERQRKPLDKSYIDSHYTEVDTDGRRYRIDNLTSPNPRANLTYEWKGYAPPAKGWRYSKETMADLDSKGLIWYPSDKTKRPGLKRYLTEEGAPVPSIWIDIPPVNSQAREDTGYDTQKPEKLMERIIKASSRPGDLVADFFVGSGTTAVVAEKLGRHWLAVDFGKTGIQVSRTRLVEAQSAPFAIQNIGNYQREMIYLVGSRIGEVQRVILKLYGADPRTDNADLGVRRAEDGKHELVHVGYPDRQVTARKAEELLRVAERLDGQGYPRLTILGWDYALNYTADIEARLRAASPAFRVQLQSRVIPAYIYDYLKQLRDESEVEALRPKVQFFERPYFKVRVERTPRGEIEVRIDRYVVFDVPLESAEERSEVLAEAKDNFAFLIDYWAVDNSFDGSVFRSRWQAFRGNGKKPRLVPAVVTLPAGETNRVAVRLVDIFGNDASAVVDAPGLSSAKVHDALVKSA